MTLEEFRKKLGDDEAFRTEVEAKAKSFKEQNPDKSDNEREKMLCAAYGVEMPAGTEIDDDDMDAVAGGKDAANGHEIGCFCWFTWYINEGEAGYKSGVCVRCNSPLEKKFDHGDNEVKRCLTCDIWYIKQPNGSFRLG